MRRLLPYLTLLFAVLAPLGLRAQTAVPFLLRVQQAETSAIVANGGGVSVNTNVGRTEDLTIIATYQGQGTATLVSDPEILGSTAFTVLSAPAAPIVLFPGGTYRFTVRFTPRTARAVVSQVTLSYREVITTPTSPTTSTTTTTAGTVIVQLQGTAPDFVLSYLLPDALNYVPLATGASIPFPITQVNETSTVLVSVANRGSGGGELRSVLTTGDAFQPAGVTLLPTPIAAGTELRFSLRFQPRSEGDLRGALSLTTDGPAFSVNLTGQAYRPAFAYELISRDTVSDLVPGSTINLGDALPGESLSAQVLVRNLSPVPVTLPAISLFGANFVLSDLPLATRILRAGETVSFFVQATIVQIGAQRGRLRIGDDTFDLLASGSGNQLRFSYSSGGSGSVIVAPGGSIFFTATSIGLARQATVTVRNNGTAEASLINVSLAEARTAFSLPALPTLPARLAPGQELSFPVEFRPTVTGANTATLRVDGASFTLSGSSTAAPPLPAYRFTLPSGNVNPLDQPAVGVELETAYPSALSGVLTLSQEAAGFANDPSVRFVNGTATATFTIAANTTRAVFANGSNTIRFQTGSVAGVLLLGASFSLAGSTTPLDDANPLTLRLTVPALAPRILSVQSQIATNSLLLQITGLVTTRSLTRMDIQLTPVEGFTIPVTSFTLNIEGDSLAWFRSAASQSFGGIFTLQLPLNFSLDGNGSTTTVSNLVQTISRVQVILTNEAGSSSPFVLSLR